LEAQYYYLATEPIKKVILSYKRFFRRNTPRNLAISDTRFPSFWVHNRIPRWVARKKCVLPTVKFLQDQKLENTHHQSTRWTSAKCKRFETRT